MLDLSSGWNEFEMSSSMNDSSKSCIMRSLPCFNEGEMELYSSGVEGSLSDCSEDVDDDTEQEYKDCCCCCCGCWDCRSSSKSKLKSCR